MPWMEEYRARRTTAEEAVKLIESGNRVYLGAGGGVAHSLVNAMTDRAGELKNVEVVHMLTSGDAPYVNRDMEGCFRCNALFVGPNVREAVNRGEADYIPVHLHQVPELFRNGTLPVDVACVQISPPDEHGFCSFGVEVGVTKPAAQAARIVIAEVNRQMPRTLGDSFIHISKIDACVEVNVPLDEIVGDKVSDVERQIGRNIADMIEDGACLQLGYGGIPGAVLEFLNDKRDLGVHTEMFSCGLPDLMDRGVVTGERKNFHSGKVVVGFILGDRDLFDFVHDNPLVEFHPTDYVNAPFNIARNDNMFAINSALQIDLTGQICADSIGKTIYSGFGGQVDFMRGAAMSKGGIAITALPATALGGQVSRIVPLLDEGAGVVTTRADAHCVVTENGVAWMRGRNLRQRAEALIKIAEPAFQETLLQAARERKIFGESFPGIDLS